MLSKLVNFTDMFKNYMLMSNVGKIYMYQGWSESNISYFQKLVTLHVEMCVTRKGRIMYFGNTITPCHRCSMLQTQICFIANRMRINLYSPPGARACGWRVWRTWGSRCWYCIFFPRHIDQYPHPPPELRWWLDHRRKGRFRNVNQGLNDESRCCKVHARTLPKIPTLAAKVYRKTRCAQSGYKQNATRNDDVTRCV